MRLAGATVLLTGASGGIGSVLAEALARRGARIALAARSPEQLDRVRRGVEAVGGTAVAVPGDVTDGDDRTRMIETTQRELGPLDVLVNNAAFDEWVPFHTQPPDEIRRMVELNLTSAIELTRQVLPGMLERRRGHVLSMGSTAGKNMIPYGVAYSTTKHGVVGFSLSLRAELVDTGVSASVVCPGFVKDTGMYERGWRSGVPRGTATTVDRVAAAVVRAIERDVPEIVVSGALTKVSDVALALSPRLTYWLGRSTAFPVLRREAERRSDARR